MWGGYASLLHAGIRLGKTNKVDKKHSIHST
jgi:hypothetical protein